jgi:hypothetical protein
MSSEKFLISENTPLINMHSNEMLSWSNHRDDLAAEFDFKFDGCGALLETGDANK